MNIQAITIEEKIVGGDINVLAADITVINEHVDLTVGFIPKASSTVGGGAEIK